eukprot:5124971-Pyramimonas_sp.AAC.1
MSNRCRAQSSPGNRRRCWGPPSNVAEPLRVAGAGAGQPPGGLRGGVPDPLPNPSRPPADPLWRWAGAVRQWFRA